MNLWAKLEYLPWVRMGCQWDFSFVPGSERDVDVIFPLFQQQRTVYRLTLVKAWNVDELKAYADLISLGKPDFIEVKVSCMELF